MRILYIMIVLILLFSCNRNSRQENSKSSSSEKSISNNEDSLIIENKTKHYFSNLEQKDEFIIRIKGKSILKGKAKFTIIDSNGTEIYKEEFPAFYLLNYDIDSDANSTMKEEFIKKRIENFFEEKNFTKPAIKSEEKFDETYSNKEIWYDILNDQTSIGFYFLIGEEDGKNIAFSKKSKKVVLYFNCC